MAKRFPTELFVVREEDGDSSYLVANETVEDTADLQEKKIIGVYRLDYTAEVEAKVGITPIIPR